MLKKTISYENFNGETVEEDFFFHLSKAELIELELSHKGGLSEALKRIVAAEDGKGIVQEFKNIILTAYGQKSDDGRRFIKNQQLREEFESTEAYSALFMELILDTDAAVEFINGVVPSGMAEEVAKLAAVEIKPVEEEVIVLPPPEPKPEPVVVTRAELEAMPQEDVPALIQRVQNGEAILVDTE